MEHQGQIAASNMIRSLTGWWELAGVDATVGEYPVDWLTLDAKADAIDKTVPASPVVNEPSRPTAPQAKAEWPSDIETLKAMITIGAPLPGNSYSSSPVAPAGPTKCDVMVVSDLPDQDEVTGKMLGSGATGALLEKMMAAIGLNRAESFWTALATTIPPTGEIPESALSELADFARHQIALVRPKSMILLGSSACKALLGKELMSARQSLQNFNHDGRNMAVLTTFHPRTLIARPAMKAQAWKDLQMFAKRAGL